MSKKIAYYGIFTALAIIASYLERLIPMPIAVPGIKLGLANVIVLITMYQLGEKEAFGISILRILITGLLFGSLSGIIYSFSGGILSYFAMVLGKRAKIFGVVGVSVLGGVFHNAGQIFAAALVVENMKLLYYLPALIIAGVCSGALTGFAAGYTLRHIRTLKISQS